MYLWLLITIALTVQEGLSVLAVLLRAYQLHYSLWIIHAIWLAVTIGQIFLTYFFGKWVQKSFARSRFELWIEKSARLLEKNIDSRGESVALMLLSSIISPAITAFLASWLEIPFTNVFIFALLGDFLWYVSTWATVLGAVEILLKVKEGLLVLITLAIIVVLITHFRKSRKTS